jgi:hypothetical protein
MQAPRIFAARINQRVLSSLLAQKGIVKRGA